MIESESGELSRTSCPWERQAGESGRAYAGFCAYRDLGSGRSLDKVGRQRSGDRTGRKRGSTGQLRRWSSRWHWVQRALAWDAELDKKRREAQVAAVRAMNERHVEEAMAMQARAMERLRALDPRELDAPALLRFIVESAKLERAARGVDDPTRKVDPAVWEMRPGMCTTLHERPDSISEITRVLGIRCSAEIDRPEAR